MPIESFFFIICISCHWIRRDTILVILTTCFNLAVEENRKASKLTPAIPSEFETIYYGLQTVLEATLLPKCISFVLGLPMKSKPAT